MPLKWTEDRLENLLGSYQGRGIEGELELALDRDGRMLGLRARLLADLGAYLLPTTAVPPITAAMLITGCYEIAAAEVQVTGVATNKVPTGPYRGAGRPDAAYMLEAIVDRAARELGIDRVAVAASQPDQALSAPDAAWLRVRLRRFRALPRPCRRAQSRVAPGSGTGVAALRRARRRPMGGGPGRAARRRPVRDRDQRLRARPGPRDDVRADRRAAPRGRPRRDHDPLRRQRRGAGGRRHVRQPLRGDGRLGDRGRDRRADRARTRAPGRSRSARSRRAQLPPTERPRRGSSRRSCSRPGRTRRPSRSTRRPGR